MQIISIQRLIAFLPLIRSLQAQGLLSYEDAQGIAWRSYGSFIQQYITAGIPIRKGVDFVFVNPPTSVAIRGGTPCPDSVTNNDLFQLADKLQSVDDQFMDTSGIGYNQALDNYLGSVDLGTVTLTPAQEQKIQQLEAALVAANDKFSTVDDDSYVKYLADARAQANKQTFEAWVINKAPLWTAARDNQETANAAFKTYKLSIYGPAFSTITKLKDKLELLSQSPQPQTGLVHFSDYVNGTDIPGFINATTFINETTFETETDVTVSYNMPSYGGNYNVQFKPFAAHTVTDGIRYDPLYSLSGGFEEACDAWINGTSAPFSYTWSMKNVNGKDWSSLGHSTSSTKFGGSFYSILSANHGSNTETTTFNSWTSSFSTAISLQLTMKGAPLVFNVNAGPWDVPNIRQTFPKLTKKGIDQLSTHVRLTKLLIGHQVSCTITIADSGTWKSVSQFIQDAKKDTKGGLSIFGFHFGGGGGGVTHRNITDVQTFAGSNGGSIVIPPSPVGIPMLLGAMGKAV